jgi:hypothetical protein
LGNDRIDQAVLAGHGTVFQLVDRNDLAVEECWGTGSKLRRCLAVVVKTVEDGLSDRDGRGSWGEKWYLVVRNG